MPSAPKTYRPAHWRPRPRESRPSAAQRGYDRDWSAIRALAWGDPDKVLCDHCLTLSRTVPRQVLDHVIPFRGPDDPLRLDPADLRGLCHEHHQAKTARQDTIIRAAYDRLCSEGMSYEEARDRVVGEWRHKPCRS